MRVTLRFRLWTSSALLLACAMLPWARLSAQTCTAGTLNSCMSVTFTPVRPTPEPADFQAGFAVLGALNIAILKCGRPPCDVSLAAANQPPTGIRLKVGGAQPLSLSECTIDITGVSAAPSSPAPSVALVSAATTVVVWVCQPLTWDPLLTPVGTYTPEFRFRLRQS